MRYLRSKNNGMILEWNEVLARNPNVVEVTEQEAYPERFAPVDLSKREKAVDLTVPEEVVTPPPQVAPELLAEASKPFGTKNSKPRASKQVAVTDAVGLLGEF